MTEGMSHEGLADTGTSHCVADLTFSKQQEEEVKGSSRLDLNESYELRLLGLKRRSVTRVCTVVITLLLQLIYYILSRGKKSACFEYEVWYIDVFMLGQINQL